MKKNLLTLIFAGLGIMSLATAQTQVLADTSLEASGAGGTQWTSTSTNFGTVLCDANCGTCGGPCAPHTGSWYAWFGGAGGAEIGTLTQTFNVPTAGAGTLHFYLEIPNYGAGIDSINVALDGTEVWFKLGTDSTGFESAYAPVSVNLGTVSSGSHTLVWRGIESGTGTGTYNALVDDITIQIGGTAGTEMNMLDEGIRMVNNSVEQNLYLYFNFAEATDLSISILDMSGRIVKMEDFKQLMSSEYIFNTSGLSNGVYSIYLRKGNNSAIGKKFVVQK